jgi:uncharacterized protein (DUF1697 family)
MNPFAVFLRGINVGGTGILRMDDMKKAMAKAGGKAIQTHIQSGNAVFQAKNEDFEGISAKFEARLKKLLGWEPVAIYRKAEELVRIVREEPFKKIADEEGAKGYVVLLAGEPKKEMKIPLVLEKEALEIIGKCGRDLFVVVREKADGRYTFPNAWVEKNLGVGATTRNWNTMVKMAALAGGGTELGVARRKKRA